MLLVFYFFNNFLLRKRHFGKLAGSYSFLQTFHTKIVVCFLAFFLRCPHVRSYQEKNSQCYRFEVLIRLPMHDTY